LIDFDDIFALSVLHSEILQLKQERLFRIKKDSRLLGDEQLLEKRKLLLSKEYKPNYSGKRIPIKKYDGTVKDRFVTRQGIHDMLFQRIIVRELRNNSPLIHSSAYGVKRNSSDKAYDVLSCVKEIKIQCKNYSHVYETDLISYYPSIHVRKLIHLMLENGIDFDLCEIIKLFAVRPEKFSNMSGKQRSANWKHAHGIQQGTSIAPYLAGLFLLDVDQEMSSNFPGYIRYVDDIIVLSESEKDSTDASKLLAELLEKKSVHCHKLGSPKSSKASIEDGFEFLGLRFHPNGSTTVPEKRLNALPVRISKILEGNEPFDIKFQRAGSFVQAWHSYYITFLNCNLAMDRPIGEFQSQITSYLITKLSLTNNQAVELLHELDANRFRNFNKGVVKLFKANDIDGALGTDFDQIAIPFDT
jgi:hypothetical protein